MKYECDSAIRSYMTIQNFLVFRINKLNTKDFVLLRSGNGNFLDF